MFPLSTLSYIPCAADRPGGPSLASALAQVHRVAILFPLSPPPFWRIPCAAGHSGPPRRRMCVLSPSFQHTLRRRPPWWTFCFLFPAILIFPLSHSNFPHSCALRFTGLAILIHPFLSFTFFSFFILNMTVAIFFIWKCESVCVWKYENWIWHFALILCSYLILLFASTTK